MARFRCVVCWRWVGDGEWAGSSAAIYDETTARCFVVVVAVSQARHQQQGRLCLSSRPPVVSSGLVLFEPSSACFVSSPLLVLSSFPSSPSLVLLLVPILPFLPSSFYLSVYLCLCSPPSLPMQPPIMPFLCPPIQPTARCTMLASPPC
jgi:hypothetical protein